MERCTCKMQLLSHDAGAARPVQLVHIRDFVGLRDSRALVCSLLMGYGGFEVRRQGCITEGGTYAIDGSSSALVVECRGEKLKIVTHMLWHYKFHLYISLYLFVHRRRK